MTRSDMIHPASNTRYELRARVYAIDADGGLALDELHTYDGGSDDEDRLDQTQGLKWTAEPNQILIKMRERSIVTFGTGVSSFEMASTALASVDFFRTEYDTGTNIGTFLPVGHIIEQPSLRTKQAMDLLRFIPDEALIQLSLSSLTRIK